MLLLFPHVMDNPEETAPRTWTCWSQSCCSNQWLPTKTFTSLSSPSCDGWGCWWVALALVLSWTVSTVKMLLVDQAPATCPAGGWLGTSPLSPEDRKISVCEWAELCSLWDFLSSHSGDPSVAHGSISGFSCCHIFWQKNTGQQAKIFLEDYLHPGVGWIRTSQVGMAVVMGSGLFSLAQGPPSGPWSSL